MREFNGFFLDIFFADLNRQHGMQNGEGEGGSAHVCGQPAGRLGAQERTDLAPTAESICEQVRVLGQQHAVIVCLLWHGLRSCD